MRAVRKNKKTRSERERDLEEKREGSLERTDRDGDSGRSEGQAGRTVMEEERDGGMGADRETGGMEKRDGYAEGGMDRVWRMGGGMEE